ncbi:hypothetical protein [Burkholderia metallica]|uniref:hypothetical protein n=1 Tax=Burkholderia metallica TaxID=488729 RepID=UPI0014537CB1|nr:hypothetical protein [Burkholderia metallica]VWB23160.1 hypothetical protein BME24068_00921 [Burkholderia metallica]
MSKIILSGLLAEKSMKKFGMIRRWRGCLFGACLMGLSLNASAGWDLIPADLVYSYDACAWINNGDGTSTLQVVFDYKASDLNIGFSTFVSRGVLVYTYDANGKMKQSTAAAKSVKMRGVEHFRASIVGNYHVTYWGQYLWAARYAHKAQVEVIIDNAIIKDWPGITLRAGIFTDANDRGEVTGGVYLTPVSGSSSCKVIDPEVTPPDPPAILAVDVAAPDWNLGELPRGDGEKTIAGAEQQLCFTYMGFNGGSRNFVINATSANGVSGNRYLLRNASKPEQTVPYDLTLDSGSATFRLPNTSASPVLLNNNARTCFVPTFRTSVDATVDAGDYSDVLSFTVVTKS